MIYAINIIVLYALSLLSLTVFSNLRIFGVSPLLPLFFIISLAYFRKGFEPLLLAALAGIYFDLYSSYPFGFYLVLFLFSATVVRFMFQEGMRSLSLWYYALISFGVLFIYYTAQIIYLVTQNVTIGSNFIIPVIAGLAVNLFCVILIYVLSGWYFERLEALGDYLKRR